MYRVLSQFASYYGIPQFAPICEFEGQNDVLSHGATRHFNLSVQTTHRRELWTDANCEHTKPIVSTAKFKLFILFQQLILCILNTANLSTYCIQYAHIFTNGVSLSVLHSCVSIF